MKMKTGKAVTFYEQDFIEPIHFNMIQEKTICCLVNVSLMSLYIVIYRRKSKSAFIIPYTVRRNANPCCTKSVSIVPVYCKLEEKPIHVLLNVHLMPTPFTVREKKSQSMFY